MSAPTLALIGGGEHGVVVAEAAALSGWEVAGCFDLRDDAALPVLGREAAYLDDPARFPGLHLILCVVGAGGLAVRRRVLARWRAAAPAWATVVHPTAFVAPSALLGPGVFIGPGAVVHTGARVGPHAIVNSGAVVEHDVVLGEGVHVAPGAVIGGGAEIGPWATCALGSRVRDHVSVGADAVVGMGAVVVAPVAAGVTVIGCPARPAGR